MSEYPTRRRPRTGLFWAAALLVHLLGGYGPPVDSFAPLRHFPNRKSSRVARATNELLSARLFSLKSKRNTANDDDSDDQGDDQNQDKGRIRDILLNGAEDVMKTASEVTNGDLSASKNTKFLFQKFGSKIKSKKNDNNITSSSPDLIEDERNVNNKKKLNEKVNPISYSCRIVTCSDGKVPTKRSLLPESIYQPPYLLDKLDAIYHATAHTQTRSLPFMEECEPIDDTNDPQTLPTSEGEDDDDEEQKIISILRHSLQDAGFQLLNRRDLDLVQALNADYLLRLSIMADVSALDESISQEFYPERFDFFENGTVVAKDAIYNAENFLYDGRVLVFWRGYGSEVSRGRLLLPKIDYLQASIVQKAASGVREQLNVFEEAVAAKAMALYDKISDKSLELLAYALEMIPSRRVSEWAAATLEDLSEKSRQQQIEEAKQKKNEKLFKLARYGGYRKSFASSPNQADALTPFTICEVDYDAKSSDASARKTGVNGNTTIESVSQMDSEAINHDIYEVMNRGHFTCSYDEEMATEMGKDREQIAPMQLLERVSISNLVDFSPTGRSKLLKNIFAKNTLMEPTYQEVIVVWRPLPPKPRLKPKPPKLVYDLADMFDIEGLPELPKPQDEVGRQPLEIRAFAGVPMANLPAVLPKTKLIFRPADAFVFDFVSIATLILVIGSQRFDNPRLDLLALVSFISWVFRTVIRYSNKLARYDLLVKNFLTSKITHRNSGALKYVATEAGSYRATRAALVYAWLASPYRTVSSKSCNDREQLIERGFLGVNELIAQDKPVKVDIGAALEDLEDLELVHFSADGRRLESVVRDRSSVIAALGTTWASVLEGEMKPVELPREPSTP